MVDPHDNKMSQLPFPMRRARRGLMAYLQYRNEVTNPVALAHVDPHGRRWLAELGGLASPW
jgi:hypothetical protein